LARSSFQIDPAQHVTGGCVSEINSHVPPNTIESCSAKMP
jgi:hypothetical protein